MDWNQPPGKGPTIDQAAAKIKEKLKDFKPGSNKALIGLIVLAMVGFVGSTTFYTVEPEETGVVQRLGQYVRQTSPGLHFKLPLGIEKVSKVKTGRVLKEEFGFRATLPGVRTQFTKKGFEDESLMLTGDLNVIDVKWIVQYRIRQPEKWLFGILNGREAIRDVSEAVVRRIAGNSYGDDVLTMQRVEIAAKAHKEIQEVLDSYDAGIQVVTVQLQDVTPPEPVQPAFNEVNEASQEKERMINQAQTEYNRQFSKAEGEARQVISEAEGYALRRINQAKGETDRFLAVLKEFQEAKDITQKRLYLESMQQFLRRAKKVYLVDDKQKALLPLLQMEGAK